MGTRHLTIVVKDEDYKVAQYGQWDGYPSGQGVTVLEFLRGMDRQKFEQRLEACRFGSSEEIDDLWVACGADPASDGVSFEVSDKFKELHPSLHRDCGAEVLQLIHDSDGEVILFNDIGFATDSLFCEYAYLIDLDKNVLEVYRGFNKKNLDSSERFASMPIPERKDWMGNLMPSQGYKQIKLWKTFDLNALPTEAEFLEALAEEEEEVEA